MTSSTLAWQCWLGHKTPNRIKTKERFIIAYAFEKGQISLHIQSLIRAFIASLAGADLEGSEGLGRGGVSWNSFWLKIFSQEILDKFDKFKVLC